MIDISEPAMLRGMRKCEAGRAALASRSSRPEIAVLEILCVEVMS